MNVKEVADQYLEIRGCKIKRTYMNKKQAKEAAKRMNLKTDKGRIRAYSCKFCEGYHIGHIRPTIQDRIETKRIEKVLNSHTVA